MAALADTAARFGVRHADLDLVAIGCEQDLIVARYETFQELHAYCYMVPRRSTCEYHIKTSDTRV